MFSAAERLELKRVVWASSETTLGLPFDTPPDYVPIDEQHPLRPETSYALTKVLGEEAARQFNRLQRDPLHRAALLEHHGATRLRAVPHLLGGPATCASGTCGATSTRATSAESVRRALEADLAGAEAFIIAARDTVMRTPSRELMSQVFPGVPVSDGIEEYGTLLGIDKARRMLGYEAGIQLARAVLTTRRIMREPISCRGHERQIRTHLHPRPGHRQRHWSSTAGSASSTAAG